MSVKGRRAVVMVIWVAVGIMLIWRGLPYVGLEPREGITGLMGGERWVALAAGIVIGIGKGFTALRKAARRAVRQIISRGESAPPWTVFSPAMLLLVAVMVGGGLALRLSPYDATVKAWVVGILYPAIGVGLILGGFLALKVEPLPVRH